MKPLKFITESDWEKWRVATFYTKEPETIAWISDFEPNCVFWDIGANIGIYSIFCASMHPGSTVYAFEPLRTNYIRLWDNIWLNDAINVRAHHTCMGDYTGDCYFDFNTSEVGSSGGSAKDLRKQKIDDKGGFPVPIIEGDNFCGQEPDYVKIDVDGTEMDILMGMKGLLYNEIKSILVEVNNQDLEILRLLEDAGLVLDDKYNTLKDRESDKNLIFRRKTQ